MKKHLIFLLLTMSIIQANTTYNVKKGDTLSKISKKNKITISKLKNLNNMKSDKLKIGKKLVLKSNKKKAVIRIRYSLSKSEKSKYFTKSEKTSKTKIIKEAKKHLGKKYVWAANGPKTFDCSGYTKYILSKQGKQIPRTSINQSKFGKKISRANLRPGDLIFFDTSKKKKGYVNHVGIYLGNNKFIHASSAKKKVVITNLSKKFYSNRFKVGRRIN